MITTAVEIHPLALRVPAMTDSEFSALREDIAENGLLRPITLFEGKVLDGRHRLRACNETGTEPEFEEYEGDSPATFVLSLNAKRRNLSPSQLAMLATDFLPYLETEARSRQGTRSDLLETSAPNGAEVEDGRSAGRAAELVGVSRRSVNRAKRVLDSDPALAERVRQGEVTVNAADDQIAVRASRSPTRDGSHKRRATDLVNNIVDRLAVMPMALREIDLTAAVLDPHAPLEEWDRKLTDAIQTFNRLRGQIRKEISK